jgi:3',5'-cyclic AMP phosphodiesterase CpdA
VKIVHISDLHIPPLPAVGIKRLASKRFMGWLNWYRARGREHDLEILEQTLKAAANTPADVVLITGDITNLGLPEEFERAEQLLQKHLKDRRVILTFGNHDAYIPGTQRDIDAMALRWNGQSSYPVIYEDSHAKLIVLSSAVPTWLLASGGMVNKEQLERLEQELKQARAIGKKTIIALHHPPLHHMGSFKSRLFNAREMEKIIEACKPDAILHGHLHKDIYLNHNESTILSGVTAASLKKAHTSRGHLWEITSDKISRVPIEA